MTLNVFCDGSIEGGNPGGQGASGWVIKGVDGLHMTGAVNLGSHPTMTNNVAEYNAVVEALRMVLTKVTTDYDRVIVHCDSKLVVEQCNDGWLCNNEVLRGLRETIWHLCEKFGCPVEFKWIPREENSEADAVSRSIYSK